MKQEYIIIEWLCGRPKTGADQDEARAALAAETVLNNVGISYHEAESEYNRQWLQFEDETAMTGIARWWIKARDAADCALTEGWHDPNGAGCTIAAG